MANAAASSLSLSNSIWFHPCRLSCDHFDATAKVRTRFAGEDFFGEIFTRLDVAQLSSHIGFSFQSVRHSFEGDLCTADKRFLA